MRVAFLTAHLSASATGVGSAVAGLAAAVVREAQREVHIVGVGDPRAPEDWRRWRTTGVEVHALKQWGPRAFGAAPGLSSKLDSLRPDLIHSHGLWMYHSHACLRWGDRAKRPYIVAPHGMLDPWALRRSWLKKRIISFCFAAEHLRGAACVHALNAAEAAAIRAYGLTNPICVIPNGVDLSASAPPRPAAGPPRELLFLGQLHDKKGVRELLLAWSMVTSEVKDGGWRLRIVGGGDPAFERAMSRLARDLDLEQAVTFAGPLFGRDKDAALRGAAAFILPSFSEGLPLAVLEAWSEGLPVIMSASCNLPDGFAAGAAIEVWPEPNSIAAGLRRLFAMSGEELARMGAAGRRLVEERYTWGRVGRDMAAVYRWLTDGGVPPPCVLAG